LAASPAGAGVRAAPGEALDERAAAAAGVELGGAGREIRVDEHRQRADAAAVVDRGGDGVVADRRETVLAGQLLELGGDQRLRPEALEDDTEAEGAEVQQRGGFAEGGLVEVGAASRRVGGGL